MNQLRTADDFTVVYAVFDWVVAPAERVAALAFIARGRAVHFIAAVWALLVAIAHLRLRDESLAGVRAYEVRLVVTCAVHFVRAVGAVLGVIAYHLDRHLRVIVAEVNFGIVRRALALVAAVQD